MSEGNVPSRSAEDLRPHTEDDAPPYEETVQGINRVAEVSEVGKLSKLRRRKLKRQRKKEREHQKVDDG
jgi:hypothetical protein